MVKNSVLRPIIDNAARLGEDVLSARAAQSAFERRSVHKYVFAVVPLRGGGVSPTGHDGGSGRGVAVFPELGQVVSVSGKSTLVSHRETLSLQYLRRSFLSIGRRSAWGEVRFSAHVFFCSCSQSVRYSFCSTRARLISRTR